MVLELADEIGDIPVKTTVLILVFVEYGFRGVDTLIILLDECKS